MKFYCHRFVAYLFMYMFVFYIYKEYIFLAFQKLPFSILGGDMSLLRMNALVKRKPSVTSQYTKNKHFHVSIVPSTLITIASLSKYMSKLLCKVTISGHLWSCSHQSSVFKYKVRENYHHHR